MNLDDLRKLASAWSTHADKHAGSPEPVTPPGILKALCQGVLALADECERLRAERERDEWQQHAQTNMEAFHKLRQQLGAAVKSARELMAQDAYGLFLARLDAAHEAGESGEHSGGEMNCPEIPECSRGRNG